LRTWNLILFQFLMKGFNHMQGNTLDWSWNTEENHE
jgi:hypothetical protein